MLTIYKSDEAYTTEVKPNKCISIHVLRVIFYPEENGQFGSTLTLLITAAFTLHVFLQNIFPTLRYVLIWVKLLKYADQLLHKQAKLISTSKLTRIRTIILWPVIYNNRFFSKMNGSFDPLHVRWIFLQRFERTEMMFAHRTRQGCSSASRTHKC